MKRITTKTINEQLRRCPICHGKVEYRHGAISCGGCGLRYVFSSKYKCAKISALTEDVILKAWNDRYSDGRTGCSSCRWYAYIKGEGCDCMNPGYQQKKITHDEQTALDRVCSRPAWCPMGKLA